MLQSLFDCSVEIETQSLETDMARAVLREAAEYFECLNERPYLVAHADHIMKLLYVVESILANIQATLTDTAKTILEAHKDAKKPVQEVSA